MTENRDARSDPDDLLFPPIPVRRGRRRTAEPTAEPTAGLPARRVVEPTSGTAAVPPPPVQLAAGSPSSGTAGRIGDAQPRPPRAGMTAAGVTPPGKGPLSGIRIGVAGPVHVVGVVRGGVSVENTLRRFHGMRAFAFVVLVAVGVIGLRSVVAAATLIESLVIPILVLVGLLLVYRLMLGAWSDRAARAAARGAGHATVAASRAVARGYGAALRKSFSQGREHSLTLRRFQVQSLTGGVVVCVLSGDLIGDEPRTGDLVRVTSRRTRSGHCVARRVETLASPVGPVVRSTSARPGIGLLAARWVSRVGATFAVLISAWLVLLVAGLVR